MPAIRANRVASSANKLFANPKPSQPTTARTIRTTPAVKVRSFPPDRPTNVNRPMTIPTTT
jgi:hypothetical protein